MTKTDVELINDKEVISSEYESVVSYLSGKTVALVGSDLPSHVEGRIQKAFKLNKVIVPKCAKGDPNGKIICSVLNKSNVDLITKGNLSHYEMLTQVEQKFREWSPATFLGYSSINFDDEVIRKEFFKSLRKPYLTNTEGNVRHDALNIVKAAFAIDENILKTELNSKGNKTKRLFSSIY